MEQYNLHSFYNKFGFSALISALYTLGYNKDQIFSTRCSGFQNKISKTVTINLPSLDETLELMSKVNKQVKNLDRSMSRFRNNFYSHKKFFIKHLFESGLVDQVVESENLYRFDIRGYSFHQPKVYYKKGIKDISSTEVYIPQQWEDEFNQDEWTSAIIGMEAYSKVID